MRGGHIHETPSPHFCLMQSSTQKGGHISAAYSTCIQVMKMTLSTFPFSDMPGSLEYCFGRLDLYHLSGYNFNSLGNVAGQFTAAPPTCPGDTFTFRCTVTGNRNGVTIWRVGGSSDCLLGHSTADLPGPCGSGSPFTVTTGTGFGTSNATSFSSTLSGTAAPTLDGTLVECFGPALSRDAENRVGNSLLQISGQYYATLHTYLCRHFF